ncbi:class I mannose-6-phosphate isomerase [Fusobacterium perfoetens]|uniref:type I phosphomannose isomerase catalytic subunit n=1 Tax=Fusobacterium perfoetens TaxID=852 RepID=UPI001F255734|nr:type I phosphomannose isomerase catalytic subunit [Fusobacterium perfoetens]MCF2626110.1 class I mannose-6-phosphate isomerase [Fusobacterium perfoetens]
MYPIKFKKCFIDKVWGGRAFETVLGMTLPENRSIGESWEVSSHKNGMSIVENGEFAGMTLEALKDKYGAEILGKDVFERFEGKFPILIKYLDVNDRLSVQVHPSDEYALKVEGEFGKSECWYIIDASEDAKLILGLKPGMTRETFLEKSKNKDFKNMFNEVSVKKGDFINITPGVVHASLEGSVLLCETQQNSDTTYRIYDFDRTVNGVPRPLHLEKAADVINFGEVPVVTKENSRQNIKLRNCVKQELVRCKYFNVDKLRINGIFHDEISENFKVYSILEGEGDIIYNDIKYPARKGDTYFIPANMNVLVDGNIEILKSFM